MEKLHIFHGEDEYSAREALRQLKEELGPHEELDPNTTVLDGRQLSLGELRMVCDTVPFLAGRRLVVVEGLLERSQQRSARRPGRRAPAGSNTGELGEWDGLHEYVERMPPSTVLVLLEGRLNPGNPLLRRLNRVAYVRGFPPLRGSRLQEWVRARVGQAGGRITPGAVQLLANFIGGNLRLLDGEVKKLCIYAGERPIEEVDVQRLVSYAKEASMFALIDAIVEGRRAEAMLSLRQLLDQGAVAPVIVTMLARQLHLMAQAKVLLQERAGEAAMSEALGSPPEFVLRKTLAQARAWGESQLKSLYQRLLDADLAMKTGALTEELGLELLVAEVVSGSG